MFVRNATTGNSTVIRSVVATLKPGDSMIMLSVAYGTSVMQTLLVYATMYIYIYSGALYGTKSCNIIYILLY